MAQRSTAAAGTGDCDVTIRFDHGLIVGKFYPPHAGHHHLIRTAAAQCRRVTVVVAPSSRESIPLPLRLGWLREEHLREPHVRFVGVYDEIPIDYEDPRVWTAHCALFAAAARTTTVDAVFSSEKYGDELARRFAAVHVPVDPPRRVVPISGSAIRADPVAAWAHLPPAVRAWFTRRVVVVGAESTGTTTLARALARQFRLRGGVWTDTVWVPEYGRHHTEIKLAALRFENPNATVADIVWDLADFDVVAAEQAYAEETSARTGSPILLCDTDCFATAVWRERYLGAHPDHPPLPPGRADLYLLTSHTGVPFHDDGLRDGEHLRAWMTRRFREVLGAQAVPWLELSGSYRERLGVALRAAEQLLGHGWPMAPPLQPVVDGNTARC